MNQVLVIDPNQHWLSIDIVIHHWTMWLDSSFHHSNCIIIQLYQKNDGSRVLVKDYNQQNMIKPKALQIYSSLRYIHFCATNTDYDFGAKYIYPFSIMAVLDLIQTTGVDRIKITFWRNKEFDIIPCLTLFESSSMYSSIKKDCQAKQIQMTIEETNEGDSMELIFCKK